MGLVSGYGSDSESESEHEQAAPTVSSSKLSILLPAPKSTASASASTSKPRRKHQIKVGGLSDNEENDDDDATSLPNKRPKMQLNSTTASTHSLFGMLPAPTRAPPPPKAKGKGASVRQDEEEGDGDAGAMQVAKEETGVKGKKGNADFRAMLGLKPASGGQAQTKEMGLIPAKTTSIPPPVQQPSSTTTKAPPQSVQSKASSNITAPPPQTTSKPPTTSAPEVDFFSIPSDTRPQSASTSVQPPLPTLSAAPTITDDDPYPGWHQNPDGSWVPVTPAAQAAYEAHQQQSQSHTQTLERLQQQEGIDISTLQHVDLQSARAEWEKKPIEARMGSSAALDAKYAQAAGVLPVENEEQHKNPRDKKTNFRAKQKGQLTSLFAQAEERREELEDKWAQGKQNKRAAASRYGF